MPTTLPTPSTPPSPPQRADGETSFWSKCDAFVQYIYDLGIYLAEFVTAMTALVGEVLGYRDNASSSSSTATTKAGEAATSAEASEANRLIGETARDQAVAAKTDAQTAAGAAIAKAGEAATSASQAATAKMDAEAARDQARAIVTEGVPPATHAEAGLLKLATADSIRAGTATDEAATPATLHAASADAPAADVFVRTGDNALLDAWISDADPATPGKVALAGNAGTALGAAAVGTSNRVAREDHVHPTTGLVCSADATTNPTPLKIPIANGYGLLDDWISNASLNTRGKVALSGDTGTVLGAAAVGTSDRAARADHAHPTTGLATLDANGKVDAWISNAGPTTPGKVALAGNAGTALGAAAVGTSSRAAREDHVHPTSGLVCSADATTNPTPLKIPIANGNGKLDSWITGTSDTTLGLVRVCTPAEAAALADGMVLTPWRLRYALNAFGDAPMYAVRACVNFGSDGTVRCSGNISSVTRLGTGFYGVEFLHHMPHANYIVVGSATVANAWTLAVAIVTEAMQANGVYAYKGVNGVQVQISDNNSDTAEDPVSCNVAIVC